jgi:hypothetical protein
VLQQRADLAFTRHALGQARAPGQAGQFQRHLALEAAVGACSQPDAAHAAAADLAQQGVRAHAVTGMGHRLVAGWQPGHGCQPVVGVERGFARQHLAQGLGVALVLGWQCSQPGDALGGVSSRAWSSSWLSRAMSRGSRAMGSGLSGVLAGQTVRAAQTGHGPVPGPSAFIP